VSPSAPETAAAAERAKTAARWAILQLCDDASFGDADAIAAVKALWVALPCSVIEPLAELFPGLNLPEGA
jgi:hypothetical protein